jgi:predicted porin
MASTDGIENWEIQRMNKKLLAVAVAGAFGLPGVALAQSSVTISGFFKGGYESLKYGNFANANTIRSAAAGRNSQHGVVDDSSRIIFNVREDLGGGLAAIGQVDMRFGLDTGSLAATGNTHVGLTSKNWGRLFFGRQDLHYFNRESDLTVRGSLRADSISILAYAGTGLVPIANATRTTNVIHYTTPNWGGFTLIAAYSDNASAAENDIASTNRRGRAWNLNPNWASGNWQIGYSYWSSKQDGRNLVPMITGSVDGVTGFTVPATPSAIQAGLLQGLASVYGAADQRGDRLYASYKWGDFKIGFAWDRSKLKVGLAQVMNAQTAVQFAGLLPIATGTEISNRTAWSIPVSYTWGPHSIHAHFDKARNDKAAILSRLDTKASMFAISYGYDFSKRTSIALTYARINNGADAQYNFFTSGSLGLATGAGSGPNNTGTPQAGEDPRMWGVTMRHAF